MDDRTIRKPQTPGPTDLLFEQFQRKNLRQIAAVFHTPYDQLVPQYQRDILSALEDEDIAAVGLRRF
jgi:capsid protein